MPVSMHRLPRLFAIAISLMLSYLAVPAPAHALEICADSVTLVKAALALGTIQSTPFKVKIVQGTYLMDTNLIYTFSAPITVEGGYTVNCASRIVDSANTVINIGSGHSFNWTQHTGSPTAEIDVDGLTFSNTDRAVEFSTGNYGVFSNDPGSLTFSHVHFTQLGNVLTPLNFYTYNDSINLTDVLIDHISANGGCGVSVSSVGGARVTINHMTADLQAGEDFCLSDGNDTTQMYIYNSVLWSSGGGLTFFSDDLFTLNPNTSIAFFNDIYAAQSISGVPVIQNQISTNPLWIDPANGNYRLKTSPVSPGINTGTTQIFGGEPATDIEGHSRVIGSAPDRGAYESALNDQSTLVVTNTFDSGPGSLRQAMLDSNSSPTIAKSIQFNIRNQSQVPICPAVIALSSSLPAIDSTMSIDGYTQPTSTKNTDANAFNANLCIMLKPASGTLPTGLRVLSSAGAGASLTVRGLGFGGFNQPIVLLGGQDLGHVIAGNQFGGVAHGVSLPAASLSAINIGINASGSLIVGGVNAADRNVIVGAGNSGVSVQPTVSSTLGDCQVVNNLIGLTPNGISALPNTYGIQISGSGCVVARNRVAGNTIANLFIQGDSNVVQQNLVGFNVQNNGFFTNTIGVLINGSGNTIGAAGNGGSITANIVRSNFAGGIVVKGDSAIANSINANLVYDNGNNSDGMDIDLWPTGGVAGPTPNDATDLDAGPNDLQNFPVPKSLVYAAAGTLDRPGTVTAQLVTIPGSYRIDVYFSNAINSLGLRGHAEIALTHAIVQVPAGGKLSVSLPILVPSQSAGGVISMTATNSSGSTSEIGAAMLTDTIFADGLD